MHRFKGAVNAKAQRRIKEGRYLIALDHGGTMGSGSPPLIGLFMGIGGSESAAPWVNERRRIKEGRYLIALDHGGTMGSGSHPLIGLFMGFGGSESAAPWVEAVIS